MKIIGGIILCIVVGLTGYFLGKGKVENSTGFTISKALSPDMRLGVAATDIAEIVEVCPKDGWLIFRGSGRALLIAANRYFYSLEWQPDKDISSTAVVGEPGVYDLNVNVKKVRITMDPDPKTQAYVVDDSLFVDMEKKTGDFRAEVIGRLSAVANNKLHTEDGKERLSDAIRQHLYAIYARESSKIRNVVISYENDALGKEIPFEKYRFKEECSNQSIKEVMKTDAASKLQSNKIEIKGMSKASPVADSMVGKSGVVSVAAKVPPVQFIDQKDGITAYRLPEKGPKK